VGAENDIVKIGLWNGGNCEDEEFVAAQVKVYMGEECLREMVKCLG
jgi:hypothetical protein